MEVTHGCDRGGLFREEKIVQRSWWILVSSPTYYRTTICADPTTTWAYEDSLYHGRAVELEAETWARPAPPISQNFPMPFPLSSPLFEISPRSWNTLRYTIHFSYTPLPATLTVVPERCYVPSIHRDIDTASRATGAINKSPCSRGFGQGRGEEESPQTVTSPPVVEVSLTCVS